MHGWRFIERLLCGLGFAATLTAEICSGFAPAAIAASNIAVCSAAVRRGAGILDGAREIARHRRSYNRQQLVLDSAHQQALLRSKRKARESTRAGHLELVP